MSTIDQHQCSGLDYYKGRHRASYPVHLATGGRSVCMCVCVCVCVRACVRACVCERDGNKPQNMRL